LIAEVLFIQTASLDEAATSWPRLSDVLLTVGSSNIVHVAPASEESAKRG
jgi:hypothetical protein